MLSVLSAPWPRQGLRPDNSGHAMDSMGPQVLIMRLRPSVFPLSLPDVELKQKHNMTIVPSFIG